MNYPKVSIITVCYNAEETIEKTIESVVNQSYPNLEYVIIDGDSKDKTKEIIRKYSDRIDYFLSEPDKGIYDAMMKGVKVAKGEWVLFRNSGDYFFEEDSIKKVFDKYVDDKGEDFILSNCRYTKGEYFIDEEPAILHNSFYAEMPVIHPATFIRRTTQLKYPFSIKYRNAADFCFFVKAFKEGASYFYVNEITAIMDLSQGATADHYDVTLKEDIDILKCQGAPNEYIVKTEKLLNRRKMIVWAKQHIPFFSPLYELHLKISGWSKIDM